MTGGQTRCSTNGPLWRSEWYQEALSDKSQSYFLSEYSAYLCWLGRADERTRTAYPCSSYECAVSGCWALQGFANPAYLEGFPFPALPTVAGYCVRVRVKLGSMCQESVDKTSSVALRSTGGWACGLPTRFRYLLHNAEVISVQARLFVRSGRTPGREEGATKASLPPVPAKVEAPLCIGVPTS